MALQADGKIVLGGYAAVNATGNFDFAAARLTTAGGLDTTFSGDGLATVAFDQGRTNEDKANGVAVQANGKIILSGYATRPGATDVDFAAARLNRSRNKK